MFEFWCGVYPIFSVGAIPPAKFLSTLTEPAAAAPDSVSPDADSDLRRTSATANIARHFRKNSLNRHDPNNR